MLFQFLNKLSTSATLFSFYFKFTDYFCEQNNSFTASVTLTLRLEF